MPLVYGCDRVLRREIVISGGLSCMQSFTVKPVQNDVGPAGLLYC